MTPLQVTTGATVTVRCYDIDADASITVIIEPGAGRLVAHLTKLVSEAIDQEA